MDDYHVVSFSGGKDSTAMLLHMIELDMHIDEVINFDTGVEFPSMYEHIEKVSDILTDKGIKFTVFRPPYTFEYFLLEREREGKDMVVRSGWGWPNINHRWCTAHLKTRNSDKYIQELSKKYNVIQYLGIAHDESKRMERKLHQSGRFCYPLVDWKWTEKDCLTYCYNKGYDWGGLYELFPRVSCWLCPLQRFNELFTLWDNFPELWSKLKEWDDRLTEIYGTNVMQFKLPYNIEKLEKRFEIEKRRKMNNVSTNSKNFFREVDIACNGLQKNQTTLEGY